MRPLKLPGALDSINTGSRGSHRHEIQHLSFQRFLGEDGRASPRVMARIVRRQCSTLCHPGKIRWQSMTATVRLN